MNDRGLAAGYYYYAVAALVENCVYRALNVDPGRPAFQNEQAVREKILGYDREPITAK